MDWSNRFRMSVPVDLKDLICTIQDFGLVTYLISSGLSGHPHVTHSKFEIIERSLVFNIGKKSTKNIEQNPNCSLLWPPNKSGGYNLIVDGVMEKFENDAGQWKFHSNSAILHRTAELSSPGAAGNCVSDCKPV